MNILLTNDDGILAPGIAAMYHELVEVGRVTVVAPESGQSAAAHAITVQKPVAVSRIHAHNQFYGFSVDGRPADCVKLGLQELMEEKPDLVVSGINDGANVGINILYSGTVAAAADGAFFGIPSIAVSMEHGDELDFGHAARIARHMIEAILEHGFSKGQLININIPDLRPDHPRGVRIAPQAPQSMNDTYVSFKGPDNRTYYWLNGAYDEALDRQGDLQALTDGYVVVTPLHFNLTDEKQMAALSEWKWPNVSSDA